MMRNTMHANNELTDAQKIYQLGLQDGKPSFGNIGARPEWFFRGFGKQIRASGQTLIIPGDALDGGEEAELVVIYLNNMQGIPYRVGFSLGNEFSDHILEKQNHYYLAQSKLRTCAIGPEIYLGKIPNKINGNIKITRQGDLLWEKQYNTGSDCMTHSLNNIEHHVFKHDVFREPGDVHFLFLGADQVSFADQVKLESDDVITISADLFQHPLVNRIERQAEIKAPFRVQEF
jgi:hypothetical protein